MARTVQIRLSDRLYRALEARAARAGATLADFLLSEVRKVAERPSREELIKRLAKLPPVRLRVRPADAVRAERERR